MPAPKGNEFWKVRSTHGANPKFKTAEDLLDACQQYFQWVEDNPLYESRPFAYQGTITFAEVPKMRAMTIGGLCLFIDISPITWREWREEREDLAAVIAWAENAIYQQKFAGASADMLNANIIARDLGLTDKSEISGSVSVKKIERVIVDPSADQEATD